MDSDSKYPPKLMFADKDGQYYMEYIPEKMYRWEVAWEQYRNKRRLMNNKPMYYWHLRSAIPVKIVKILDVNFILHVLNDHDKNNPVDGEEYRYFNEIYPKYQKEISVFLSESVKSWRNQAHAKKIYLQKDPYFIAYKKHWVDTYAFGSNMRLFYHGVNQQEAKILLDSIFADIDKAEEARAKALGMSLEEYYDSFKNPPKDCVKDNQAVNKVHNPNKESFMSNSEALHAIYWSMNVIFTAALVISYNVYGAYDSSIWDRIMESLMLLVFMQILFLPPYFLVEWIRKLTKKQ